VKQDLLQVHIVSMSWSFIRYSIILRAQIIYLYRDEDYCFDKFFVLKYLNNCQMVRIFKLIFITINGL
jgi:hypothetical protein